MSTLSLDDGNESDHETLEIIQSETNLVSGNTMDSVVSDSTASRPPPTHDFTESKKKQESASHSDIPQHLTRNSPIFAFQLKEFTQIIVFVSFFF